VEVVFPGGVALYEPPTRVRPRKGFIGLAQSLVWSARRGMLGASESGTIARDDIGAVACDTDGSVIVAYVQEGRERQLAFWPHRDGALGADAIREQIARWLSGGETEAEELARIEQHRPGGTGPLDPAEVTRFEECFAARIIETSESLIANGITPDTCGQYEQLPPDGYPDRCDEAWPTYTFEPKEDDLVYGLSRDFDGEGLQTLCARCIRLALRDAR